jgi:hypothetical protein
MTPQGASPEKGRKNLLATVVVLSIVVAGVLVFAFRKKLAS